MQMQMQGKYKETPTAKFPHNKEMCKTNAPSPMFSVDASWWAALIGAKQQRATELNNADLDWGKAAELRGLSSPSSPL